MEPLIDPRKFIQELSISELCETAERYYAELPDVTPVLCKPFSTPAEAVALLSRIVPLFCGLRLGPGMVVLDFGAGSCWLSRLLNQMRCATISVDPSTTALELGKRLFKISPIIGDYIQPPRFLPFDGRHIDVEDGSVDRIVCFDTFHHVPNQTAVLRELHRVLAPGGIAGFCEPGPLHSRSPQAQAEMSKSRVLENDIRLDEILPIASAVGFTDLRVKPVLDPFLDMSYEEYASILQRPPLRAAEPSKGRLASLRLAFRHLFAAIKPEEENPSPEAEPVSSFGQRVLGSLMSTLPGVTVFFLSKGHYVSDSRCPQGLRHRIEILHADDRAGAGQDIAVTLRITNTGQSTWLCSNVLDIGAVRVGLSLFSDHRRLLDKNWVRVNLDRDITPGSSVIVTCRAPSPLPGDYVVGIDMVSEFVTWFEDLGSQPQYFDLHVS